MKKKLVGGPYTFSPLGEKNIPPSQCKVDPSHVVRSPTGPPNTDGCGSMVKAKPFTMYLPSIEMPCHSHNLYNSGPLGQREYSSLIVVGMWAKFHWKILLGKWFFKVWSRDYFRKTNICFLAAILKRNIFLTFFLLIYGCFRCIQIWCKFRTEIPTGKYLKMVGSKWTPLVHKQEWKVA